MKFACTYMFAFLVIQAGSLLGQSPLGPGFTYQGRLKNAGSPANGSYSLIFTLFDSATGGTQVGAPAGPIGVSISEGLFATTLNSAGEFGANAFDGDRRWLEISVNGTTLAPRQELTAAPYALAVRAPLDLAASNGGIGTIKGANSAANSGSIGIEGLATAPSGTTYGVLGRSDSDIGYGLYGFTTSATGANYGVFGESDSPTGFGGYFVGRGYFSGNVGIGTSTPGQLLDVHGGSIGVDGDLVLSGSNPAITNPLSGGRISFLSGSKVALNPTGGAGSGNVGIWTSNPQEALDVGGTVQMTGFKLPTGAAASLVLTSDAAGNATWQASSGSAYSAGAGLTLTGNQFSIAALSVNNGMLGAGAVTDAKIVDVSWAKVTGAPAFLSAASVAPRLTGTGAGGSPLDLASQGASSGQVLKWNGASWAPGSDSDSTYSAGNGLTLIGSVLSASFGGAGSAITVSRSDHTHPAGDVVSGTLADARLSTNVALLNRGQVFTDINTFTAAPQFNADPPFKVISTSRVNNLNADQLDGLDSSVFLQGVPVPLLLASSGSDIVKAENSSTASGSKAIFGRASATSGSVIGVRGETASGDGRGVYGVATGGGYGVFAESSSTGIFGKQGTPVPPGLSFPHQAGVVGVSDLSANGIGVTGLATAASGSSYGGYFESSSINGVGVSGSGGYAGVSGSSGNGRGVYGVAGSGAGYGIFGESPGTAVFGKQGSPVPPGLAYPHPAAVVGVSDLAGTAIGVTGWATVGTGTTSGGYFQSDSTDGRGVYGLANATTGINYGGYFESASTDGRGVFGLTTAGSGTTDGRGVYGLANASGGINYGVFGQSNSSGGRGIYGYAPNGGIGVFGQSPITAVFGKQGGVDSLGTTYSGGAVVGVSDLTVGTGVSGQAIASTGTTYGVNGQSSSTSGRGVYGFANASTGTTYGVYGQITSTTGRGVYGQATAGTGLSYGGYFESNSISGVGVYGLATAGTGSAFGVFGESASTSGRGLMGYAPAGTGTTYGVYGQSNSATGYGLWAQGRTGASGTKSFRIDHPADPENKYLMHYSMESPEVLNVYSGKATLNASGGAVVQLPLYFATINKDPRYTLTAIGAAMPMLHVAEEIDEAALSAAAKAEPSEAAPACSFRIAGGAPGAKVSWEVKALRNDRWVQQRGAPVEVEKQGIEKGTYQHPELYGQPPEKGVNYSATRHRPEPERSSPSDSSDVPSGSATTVATPR
jgi:hypothetical protein